MIILTGTIQLVSFILCFIVLVPVYQTLGAAISVLVVSVISSLMLLVFEHRGTLGYVMFTCLSVLTGFIVAQILNLTIFNEQQFSVVILSVAASIVVLLVSKNLTITETRLLIKSVIQSR